MIPNNNKNKNRKTRRAGKSSKRKGGNRESFPLRTVAIPLARNYEVKSRAPRVNTNSDNTRISGHELIGALSGTVGYGVNKIYVNPGLSVYTWLSQQAHGWEKYKFISLELIYVPSNAVTTTPGSVFLVADYDAEDPAPPDLQALSTYETQSSGKVYESVHLKPLFKRMNDVPGHKFIRDTAVAANLSLYDPCSFSVATVDCANTNPLGQLWVNYTVELISPQTQNRIPVVGGLAQFTGSAPAALTTAVASPVEFPDVVSDNMVVPNDTATFTPPKGVYTVRSVADIVTTTDTSITSSFYHQVGGVTHDISAMISEWVTTAGHRVFTLVVESILAFDGIQTMQTMIKASGGGALSVHPKSFSMLALDR